MKNTNKKSINLSFKMLFILVAYVLIFMPLNKVIAAPTFVPGHYNNDGSYTFGDFVWNNSASIKDINNPIPAISSIDPDFSNIGVGTKIITISGKRFIPSSIARVNASSRPTTFIDSSHILMQITGDDTSAYEINGGFYITVFNEAPGGGYSNAVFFSIGEGNNTGQNFSNLASNAIFGSNGFLPSGLMQWILFAIAILLIVILARKISSAKKNYNETPMKHD
jgi:hypothetical protein